MPTFDIVNKIDMQEVDNAVNNTAKEIQARFDFKDSNTIFQLKKADENIFVESHDHLKLEAIKEIFVGKCVKRNLNMKSFEFKELQPASGGRVKQDILIKQGISKEIAQKIVKLVKESKIKVQASIQEDQVRVSGKKRDDLQEAIKLLRASSFDIPIQFVNMRD